MGLQRAAFRYDTSRKEWSQLPQTNSYRESAAVLGAGGKVYAFGGGPHRYARSDADMASTFEVFDPATDQWTEAEMPAPRSEGRAVEVDGKIFLFGGRDPTSRYEPVNRVDVFDPATGEWQDPPFHLPTTASHMSAWVQDGELHLAGGRATHTGRQKVNEVHEVMNPATGEVRDAADIDAPDHASTMALVEHQGRLFAMGAAGYDHDDSASFLMELAEPPASSDGPSGNVVTIINHNHNVDVDVHVSNVLTSISNRVDVTHITQVQQSIEVNNTSISQHVVSLDVMNVTQNNRYTGFFDPDNDFFLRTTAGNKPLLSVGQTPDGPALVGVEQSGTSPAPKNASLFLFHPESETLVPFGTDKNGQFAVPLPPDLSGEAVIFAMDGDEPSRAAPVQLPAL